MATPDPVYGVFRRPPTTETQAPSAPPMPPGAEPVPFVQPVSQAQPAPSQPLAEVYDAQEVDEEDYMLDTEEQEIPISQEPPRRQVAPPPTYAPPQPYQQPTLYGPEIAPSRQQPRPAYGGQPRPSPLESGEHEVRTGEKPAVEWQIRKKTSQESGPTIIERLIDLDAPNSNYIKDNWFDLYGGGTYYIFQGNKKDSEVRLDGAPKYHKNEGGRNPDDPMNNPLVQFFKEQASNADKDRRALEERLRALETGPKSGKAIGTLTDELVAYEALMARFRGSQSPTTSMLGDIAAVLNAPGGKEIGTKLADAVQNIALSIRQAVAQGRPGVPAPLPPAPQSYDYPPVTQRQPRAPPRRDPSALVATTDEISDFTEPAQASSQPQQTQPRTPADPEAMKAADLAWFDAHAKSLGSTISVSIAQRCVGLAWQTVNEKSPVEKRQKAIVMEYNNLQNAVMVVKQTSQALQSGMDARAFARTLRGQAPQVVRMLAGLNHARVLAYLEKWDDINEVKPFIVTLRQDTSRATIDAFADELQKGETQVDSTNYPYSEGQEVRG